MHQSSCRSLRSSVLLMLALSAALAGCKKDAATETTTPAPAATPAAAPAAAVVDTDSEFTANAGNPDN
ncbi:MAG: PQQ-dependent dehydrogenase, methanol/ethanol family, partial [Oxalobacteraceae bacterium]